MITQDEVRHIATLAKIKLTEAEVAKFTGDLSNILDFFADLQEVNTEGIPETSQVTGTINIMREDQVHVTENTTELLECSPHEIENHSLKIPKIM